MRELRHLILTLFLAAQFIASAGLGDRLVLCLGPHGHLAIEQADHEPGCGHGCGDKPGADRAIAGVCQDDHRCTDIGLAQQLTNRLPTNRKVSAPPVASSATVSVQAESAMSGHCSWSGLSSDLRGLSQSPSFLRTVVLRL